MTATPRRPVAGLAGVARATVVGRVSDVAGDGPAVETWDSDGTGGRSVSGRTTRPFVVDDGTGRISVRVPPDGTVVFDASDERGDRRDVDTHGGRTGVVERGDRVAVTGRVVSDTDRTRTLTGPAFALVASP